MTWRKTLDATCAHWIGYAVPPARDVVIASAWTPDERGRVCPRCASTVGAGEVAGGACVSCRGRPLGVDAVVRLGPHRGELRHWILEIKFRHRWWALAETLGRRLAAVVAAHPLYDAERATVVPMPMPSVRRLARGIDHAHAIATGVAAGLGRPCRPVLRHAGGMPQTRRGRPERRRGPRLGEAGRRGALAGRQVVLVDDVRTTGATLRAAARALTPLGPATVLAAVLAVRDEPGRRPPEGEVGTFRISPI